MKIIAALRTKVDNDTNYVIASFVGVKVSPTSVIIKKKTNPML
jgi:DNA-binding beta-propeller fold protein YncE